MSAREGSRDLLDEALQHALDGRFELKRQLGRGGMATVYEAYDWQAERPCAIKVLRPELGRSQDLVRFKREYRTALRLHHSSCVEVYEQWLLPDRWFYSMQLFSEGSLAQVRRPLRSRAVVRIGLQVLSALDYIHALNIVHRDVKPDNILVGDGEYARVALADFGIAQVADLDGHLVASVAAGSPRYIAPETLEHGVADPRADLYALGIVLYELLSGRHPLESAFSSTGRWRLKLLETAPDPLPARGSVPPALGSLIMRLIDRHPDRRPRTAVQAFEELSEIADDEPIRRLLPSPIGRPYLAATPLIGRRAEVMAGLRFVHDTLNGDAHDAPVVLAVTGAAGSGKSRLMSAIAKEAARAGARVLVGQCREETGVPYRELRTIVNDLTGLDPVTADLATISSRGSAEGDPTGWTGTYATTLEDEPTAVEEYPPSKGRFTVRRAVDSLLACASTSILLIIVEDVQWIGSASAQLFAAWVRAVTVTRRRGRSARVAFVVTHRKKTDAFLDELGRDLHAVEYLEVPALGTGETAELVAALFGQHLDGSIEAFCRQVFPERACTPLFVRQVLQLLLSKDILHDPGARWDGRWRLDASRLVDADLPATLREAIGDRAARLSVETQRVLSMASVGGRRFGLPVLCNALERDEELVVDCLDEAERASLVAQDASSDREYVFVHDRHRESIYQHLGEAARREHHVRWAEALVLVHGRDRDFLPDLAYHYAAGEHHAKAYEYAVLAADAALQDSAFSQAAEMYRRAESEARAAGLSADSAVSERHGDACMNAGLYVEARDCYHDRLAHARGDDRDAVLVKLASLQFRGAVEGALDKDAIFPVVDEAMEQLGLRPPKTRIGLTVRAILGGLQFSAWMFAPRMRWTRSRADTARLKTLLSVTIIGAEIAYFFEPRLYAYYGLRLGIVAARLDRSEPSAIALAALCFGASRLGNRAMARRFAVRAERLEPSAGLTPERAYVRFVLGLSFYTSGDLEAAESQLKQGHALLERSGEPVRHAILLAVLTLLLIHRGDTEQARRFGQRMIERGELLGVMSFTAQGRATMCIAAYYDGDFDSATTWAESFLREERVDAFSEAARALVVQACRLERGQSADLTPAQGAIDRWQTEGFIGANLNLVMVTTAACIRAALRTRSVDAGFVVWLSSVCRRERALAMRIAPQTSIYLGVVAARDALLRRRDKARRGFERALGVAHRVGVIGDAWLIERLSKSLEEASFL